MVLVARRSHDLKPSRSNSSSFKGVKRPDWSSATLRVASISTFCSGRVGPALRVKLRIRIPRSSQASTGASSMEPLSHMISCCRSIRCWAAEVLIDHHRWVLSSAARPRCTWCKPRGTGGGLSSLRRASVREEPPIAGAPPVAGDHLKRYCCVLMPHRKRGQEVRTVDWHPSWEKPESGVGLR